MESVFEIIGPPMIGPSSSHTAGAARIGFFSLGLLGDPPTSALIGLHGSFAATGAGHATDRALIAGLLGFHPDDERLKDSKEIAAKAGLQVAFSVIDLGENAHPNSVRVELHSSSESIVRLDASSVGGGSIHISSIDGFDTSLTGCHSTLIFWHTDRPGFLAQMTSILAVVGANIATIRTSRKNRAAEALTTVELDAKPESEALALLRILPALAKLRYVERLP